MGDVGDVHLGGEGGIEPNHSSTGGWQGAKNREKRVVCWCTCIKILQAHHIAVGRGVDEVSGGVHLDVGVLRLPHRVSPHRVEELVNTGGERG